MLDLAAPIIPGESAAGLRVGARLADLPPDLLAEFTVERRINPCLPNAVLTIYRSAAVTLHVENRVIDQIIVHDGYRGTLDGQIGIGSTLDEVAQRIGPVTTDEEPGQTTIPGIPGLRFEVAVPAGVPTGGQDRAGAPVTPAPPSARITRIAVYRV